MSPRVIHIPLSGGDRKHQAKEMRAAERTYRYKKAHEAQIRDEIAALVKAADGLAAEAWNAALFLGAELSAQETPTVGQVLNGGFDTIEVKCRRCGKSSDIDLRALKLPEIMFMQRVERQLHCKDCSISTGRRHQADIIRLKSNTPDPEEPRVTQQKKARLR